LEEAEKKLVGGQKFEPEVFGTRLRSVLPRKIEF
jgi:hypothetical protein